MKSDLELLSHVLHVSTHKHVPRCLGDGWLVRAVQLVHVMQIVHRTLVCPLEALVTWCGHMTQYNSDKWQIESGTQSQNHHNNH